MLMSLGGCSDHQNKERPADVLILDEIGILQEISESVEKQLVHIRRDYDLEVVLAAVTTTGEKETLKEMTARLFSQWHVGRNYDGRGLLLLFVDREKEIRIEVGMALEGVFTDLFTGYIENKQLKSYYLSDQLEIGLVAVLEEIEARASLMARDEATPNRINSRDLKFLSSGGGADVALSDYEPAAITDVARQYPAAQSPDEAWQTLIQSWRDKNRNPDIGVYTPVTRLIYRAYVSQPNRRFEQDVQSWADRPYEIIQNEDYAVVFFGNKKGWENAPFLFCRTNEGWQFDMVHQRKIVRMGRAPFWGIERGEHPYITLLSRCPYWMGQDIPRREVDLYEVADDGSTVKKILALEQQLKANPNDFATLLELGRLYTLTSMGQQRINLLNKANELIQDHPDVLWNLAIAHVDAHYQYKTALHLMDRYVRIRPEDPFGHFYRGYLQFMEKQPGKAIKAFKEGLTLEPENIYGLCKLARAYHARNERGDQKRAAEILARVMKMAPHHLRVKWLKDALQ